MKEENKQHFNSLGGKPEDMILNQGIDFTKPIQLKTWVCKVCSIDNQGVICSECCKMYNHADSDCFLKE